MTKAQYERKLGPLLTGGVDPALHAVVGNGGIANPARVTTAIALVRLAYDQMAALTPPTAVADLHKQAVATLSALISHMSELLAAEVRQEESRMLSAISAIKTDAQHLQKLGGLFMSRGY